MSYLGFTSCFLISRFMEQSELSVTEVVINSCVIREQSVYLIAAYLGPGFALNLHVIEQTNESGVQSVGRSWDKVYVKPPSDRLYQGGLSSIAH